jgi:ribosome assembly protein 1
MRGSLKGRLERNKPEDANHETESDFDNYIETGFQLATFQGPLCSEPVEGMAYFVESVKIDGEALSKEIGQTSSFR